jgi:SAM-dependent methyltransferase
LKKCLGCSAPFDGIDWRCPACGYQPPSADGIVLHAPELVEGDGTDAQYPLDLLVRAEASHFWFRSRAALIAASVATYFPTARSFMEIGTGGGGVLLEIQRSDPTLRLVGTELLIRGLFEARNRMAGVELLQMDARRIPFTSEFDVIGAFDIVEHIDDDAAVFEQVHAALVPGGGIIVTVPQHPWLWSAFDEFSGHRRRYTRRQLVAKMTAAGFGVVRVTSFISFALPLLAAARLRRRNRKIDLARELAIPAVLNRMLLGIAALERAAISAGASLPAGGSLLAVGVRRA